MNTGASRFNRNLLITLACLFLLTQVVLILPELMSDSGQSAWWMLSLNLLILSIPLGLLYGSIYIILAAWREHRTTGQVNSRLAGIIHWMPRIASILIIGFMGLFSLDVFEIEAQPLELLVGFLMHNIPSLLMLALLFFAWKRPVVGFAGFLAVALLFTILFVRSIFGLMNLLVFVLPILMIALLFYIDWKWLGTSSTVAQA